VDAASTGDVIKVAAGEYTTDNPQVLTVRKGVQILGGYRVGDWTHPDPLAHPAVVDAEQVPGRRGVYIDGSGVPTITLSGFQIRRGHALESDGGGVYVAGGVVVLEHNTILSSTADVYGGALFVSKGNVTLRSNSIRGNSAQYGAGLFVAGGDVTLEANTFLRNVAVPVGGVLAIDGGAVTAANDVIAQNALAGAGVYLTGGHLTARHWTLVNNGRYGVIADLGIDIDSGSAMIQNSIVALHRSGLCGAGAVAHQTLFHDVSELCIAGASCINNLFGDPKFSDPSSGDYHISSGSAAVDQGYGVGLARDFDGESRPAGAASDIGADEVWAKATFMPLVVRQFRPRVP
jgi:hypothetical protein